VGAHTNERVSVTEFNGTYLGDAVYADFNEQAEQVELYTSDGLSKTNVVWLEGPVLHNFVAWAKSKELITGG
jgi:hypothetical protein